MRDWSTYAFSSWYRPGRSSPPQVQYTNNAATQASSSASARSPGSRTSNSDRPATPLSDDQVLSAERERPQQRLERAECAQCTRKDEMIFRAHHIQAGVALQRPHCTRHEHPCVAVEWNA